MRFEPEHDPDPERQKFRVLENLEDMPESHRKLWRELENNLKTIIADQRQLHELSESEALMRYIAFQELQINSLQDEVKHIYRAFDSFAEVIDRKQDKKEPDWS